MKFLKQHRPGWVTFIKDMSVVLTVFYVMQAVDTRNKEKERKMEKRAVFEAPKNHEDVCICL